jgi:hypothetical protein
MSKKHPYRRGRHEQGWRKPKPRVSGPKHAGQAKVPPCVAKSVEQCWRIARRAAEAYQRQYALALGPYQRALCLAARDAASRIALKIRFGTTGQRPGSPRS